MPEIKIDSQELKKTLLTIQDCLAEAEEVMAEAEQIIRDLLDLDYRLTPKTVLTRDRARKFISSEAGGLDAKPNR